MGFSPLYRRLQALGSHDRTQLCVVLDNDNRAALIIPPLKPNRGAPYADGIGGHTANLKHHLFIGFEVSLEFPPIWKQKRSEVGATAPK